MSARSFAQSLKKLFSRHTDLNDDFFDDLGDSLIEGDLGARFSNDIVEELQKRIKTKNISGEQAIKQELFELLRPYVLECNFLPPHSSVSVYVILGVNGVGKTTSVAKLASWYSQKGCPLVVMAAADTFRAAAIDQLRYHGDALSIRVIAHQHGSDPAAVVFSAADSVASSGGGLVLVDTAGRLHNKEHLVRELQKIDRIAREKAVNGEYRKLLILDATTGQNALRQAEVFHEAIGIDAIVLTKYDSTSRGGVAITAGKEYSLPVAFIGTGEGYSDMSVFNADQYLRDFLDLE